MAVRTTITDRVFASLRESILTGELEAGSLHSIYRLADLLEVSRTPVRDAVLRLADLDLVTIERNRGVRVRGVSADDVRSVFELRLMLEVPAAAHAAEVVDDDLRARLAEHVDGMRAAAARDDQVVFEEHDRALHHEVGAALGNPRLPEEVARLRGSIQARGASTLHRSREMADILAEHVPIVAAIDAGDPRAAATAMRDHLLHTATLLMAQVGGADAEPPRSSMLRWGTVPEEGS